MNISEHTSFRSCLLYNQLFCRKKFGKKWGPHSQSNNGNNYCVPQYGGKNYKKTSEEPFPEKPLPRMRYQRKPKDQISRPTKPRIETDASNVPQKKEDGKSIEKVVSENNFAEKNVTEKGNFEFTYLVVNTTVSFLVFEKRH